METETTQSPEPSSAPIPLSETPADQLPLALGWDTQRTWANGVQVFASPDHVLFVLKEQVAALQPSAEGATTGTATVLARNVGSFVLPLAVAKSFKEIMTKLDLDEIGG